MKDYITEGNLDPERLLLHALTQVQLLAQNHQIQINDIKHS